MVKLCSVIVMDILEVKDLTVKVEGKPILKGVTFSLKCGESHILFGPNGSGKTTLISALMGLPTYEVTQGTIIVQWNRHHHKDCGGKSKAWVWPSASKILLKSPA